MGSSFSFRVNYKLLYERMHNFMKEDLCYV